MQKKIWIHKYTMADVQNDWATEANITQMKTHTIHVFLQCFIHKSTEKEWDKMAQTNNTNVILNKNSRGNAIDEK